MTRSILGFSIFIVTSAILLAGSLQSAAPTQAQADATATDFVVGVTPLGAITSEPSGGVGITPIVTFTPSPTLTPTVTPSATPTPTLTSTPTPTLTPTPSPTPTVPLLSLTPPEPANTTNFAHQPAGFAAADGWSCGDFPCADDFDGFKARIQVPDGYALDFVGQFPGQPMQITYGPDGRLYGTVITDPVTREGAVYVQGDDGTFSQYGPTFVSPVGLAFQPGTDVLYVSARLSLAENGGVWRVRSDGSFAAVLTDLPCCFQTVDNQPNGMIFGPDGYLYLGVGALTDRAEPENPRVAQFAELQPLEASVLRIQPHTAAVEVFAAGIRNPYDIAVDTSGQFYATDNGMLTGPTDRLLKINAGAHYGWPYWRGRGCEGCPLPRTGLEISPDWFNFPDYTLPRGLMTYTGQQFPQDVYGSLFVALWHNTANAQRVVRIDPATVPADPEALNAYMPEPFVTGLIRPVDVTMAPDGSLVIADFIYGHVWRVSFTGETALESTPSPMPTVTLAATATAPPEPEDADTSESPQAPQPLFVTSTPRPTMTP